MSAMPGDECVLVAIPNPMPSLHRQGAVDLLNTAPAVNITRNFIRAKRPCAEGFRWFLRRQENGSNYQALRDDLQVGGEMQVGGAIEVGRGIEASGSVACDGHLQAGWGVRAGGDIRAGGAIRVGESLQAGESIEAGHEYGIFAGLVVPMPAWESSAWVRASHKPLRLFSGHWSAP